MGNSSNTTYAIKFHSVNIDGDKLYIVGGTLLGVNYKKVLVYNYVTDTFEEELELPHMIEQHTTHIFNDRMYIFNDKKVYVSGAINGEEPEEEVDRIHLLLEKGEQALLSLSQNLSVNLDYIWTSDNTGIASVDMAGNVSAKEIGQTRIYAESGDGTFKQHIHVKVVGEGCGDEHRLAVDLMVGESERLYLSSDTSTVWTSLDPTTVSVDINGKVKGVKKGLALIEGFLKGARHYIYIRV